MSKKRKTKKPRSLSGYSIHYGKKTFRFIGDRVVIFRLMRRLHGRFWGIVGMTMLFIGLVICSLIRPDMVKISTAFSDFGRDVRTAPYLSASLFFAAYGLWRWRNYLRRTLKHSRPVTSLVTLTVTGFYIAALMPVAWYPWPYRFHVLGVILSGIAMAATVVVDTLLTRSRRNRQLRWWQLLRSVSFVLIVVGGYITFGSTTRIEWFQLALLGELTMYSGYMLWVIDKTYQGEGAQSQLSKLLSRVILIS